MTEKPTLQCIAPDELPDLLKEFDNWQKTKLALIGPETPCVRIDVASPSNFCVNLWGKRERVWPPDTQRNSSRALLLSYYLPITSACLTW